MADTPLRIGPTELPTSLTTLHTVGTGTLVLRGVRIVNTTDAQRHFDLAIGDTGMLYSQFVVLPRGVHDWSGWLLLSAGELLRGKASETGVVVTVSGVQTT